MPGKRHFSHHEEKLKEIILFVLESCEDGIRFKCKNVKLLYVLVLHFVEKFKCPLTNLKYRCHFYGPYSKEVEKTLDSLEEEDVIRVEETFNPSNGSYHCTIKLKEYSILTRLSEEEKREISCLLEKYRDKSLHELLEEIYDTSPFRRASLGEPLVLEQTSLRK